MPRSLPPPQKKKINKYFWFTEEFELQTIINFYHKTVSDNLKPKLNISGPRPWSVVLIIMVVKFTVTRLLLILYFVCVSLLWITLLYIMYANTCLSGVQIWIINISRKYIRTRSGVISFFGSIARYSKANSIIPTLLLLFNSLFFVYFFENKICTSCSLENDTYAAWPRVGHILC